MHSSICGGGPVVGRHGSNCRIGPYTNDGYHLSSPPNPIGGWSPNDLYEDASDTIPPVSDTYVPPYHPGHTGWTVEEMRTGRADYGRQLILKNGEVGQFSVRLVESRRSAEQPRRMRCAHEHPRVQQTPVGDCRRGSRIVPVPTAARPRRPSRRPSDASASGRA